MSSMWLARFLPQLAHGNQPLFIVLGSRASSLSRRMASMRAAGCHAPAADRISASTSTTFPGNYLIKGETQDVALCSSRRSPCSPNSTTAFDDVLQKGYRAASSRVAVAAMLAIQVVQQIQKDARMREAPTRS